MLIREVILSEGYFSELITTVQDLLVRVAAKDIKEVSTEKFRKVLAKQGFITTIDELITAIDQSGYASSVVPNNQLPDTVSTGEEEDEVDVAGMAGDQAIADIKSEL